MNIDPNRWIGTLPTVNAKTNQEKYESNDPNELVDASPQLNKNKSITKYSLTIILFILGLVFVSTIKNETRNLQKEINNLKASINSLELDLHWATLDYAVITSPENISRLSKEYLETDLVPYKKSQIKKLDKEVKTLTSLEKTKYKKNFKKNNKEVTGKKNIRIATNTSLKKLQEFYSTPGELKSRVKILIAKKIESKKIGLEKLQKLYSNPKKLPGEVKLLIGKRIETTKNELRQLYSEPNDKVKLGKVQKWAGIQVVKAMFGIPILPGK